MWILEWIGDLWLSNRIRAPIRDSRTTGIGRTKTVQLPGGSDEQESGTGNAIGLVGTAGRVDPGRSQSGRQFVEKSQVGTRRQEIQGLRVFLSNLKYYFVC